MAGTDGKRLTRQGFGYPESAAGQGEKAGPQGPSSSCDRRSTLVGNLASVELNTTRKKGEVVSQSHNCDSDHNIFCYICSKFEISFLRKNIDDDIHETFKEIFGLEMDKLGINKWVPYIICNNCRKMLNHWKRDKNRKYIKYSSPMIWKPPRCKEDCFFCCNQIKGFNAKNKNKIIYISVASVIIPIFAAQKNGKIDFGRVLEDNDAMEIDEESANEFKTESDDDYAPITKKSSVPSLVSQFELNVRNLGLPKDGL